MDTGAAEPLFASPNVISEDADDGSVVLRSAARTSATSIALAYGCAARYAATAASSRSSVAFDWRRLTSSSPPGPMFCWYSRPITAGSTTHWPGGSGGYRAAVVSTVCEMFSTVEPGKG